MLHLSTINPGAFELLKEIFNTLPAKENFALAGGTSLALQIGHRMSVDLDIFSPEIFAPAELEIILAGNKEWKYEPLNMSTRMLFCNINGIKCDFVNEPFKLIEPIKTIDSVNFYSVPDIAAMKMHTICGRGLKKDFFDIYALLETFSWKKMLEWFTLKYGESQLFFLWKSITYFDDAEEDMDIHGFMPYTKTWREIKELIKKKCR